MEERHLANADRHIAETQQRIVRQMEIVAKVAGSGDEEHLARAEALLEALQQSLTMMQAHRRRILIELGL
jgi:hypothetical protein